MNDTWNQLVAVLPPIFVCLAVIVVMAAIAYKRSHASAAGITMVGLNLALVSLLAVLTVTPIQVTPLFVIDDYAVFFWAVILVAALATCTYAGAYFKGLDDNREEFYLLVASSVLGAMALVASRHFASLFMGLELLSVPLYGMIAYTYRERQSLEAGFKYMVLSGAASSFLLFGMALLYAASGHLDYEGLAAAAQLGGAGHAWVLMGLGMILVALTFKLSLVPFHVWTPDVYEGAPAPVSTFLATVSKTAVFALLMRFFFLSPVAQDGWLLTLLGVIAFLSMFAGNLLALRQTNIKRLLGYSSIAHIGYLLTAIVAGIPLSIEATGVYLATYVGTTLGAFGVVSLVSSPFAGRDAAHMDHYRGLYWKRPVLAVSMAIMMLSLAGIPLTMGFIGKFYILSVAVAAGLWWLVAGIIIGSGIGLFYYLRVMALLFMERPTDAREPSAAGFGQTAGTVVIWLLAAVTIIVGIYPTWLIDIVGASSIAGIG
ncbi:NADH-quinone oxidoreductase subunit NuoN [Salinisphaera hydrothermalis]|uniref:NADH-quinone oxidoreductase subunit N n=1 Tax=Salinisphaera hydrothermalis (strain C41B8) TaxID=1304275 RepID=A0A084IHH6_SALHC|nr:NADH-quinone oxidoreductase subunit NuoN [Salinisphaera hydrothermalis]KEZ76160.1 NAD(P)H-quinone oxidoreductase subunit 2 [Salinisphaera hydrothermalis C41B8]